MEHKSALERLLENAPVQETWELQEAGIHQTTINRAVTAGKAVRLVRGVIARPDVAGDSRAMEAALSLVTGGVLWGLTAAYRHDLTDELPPKADVLVNPSRTRLPAELDGPYRLKVTKSAGALRWHVHTESVYGVPVTLTSKPRTVLDLYLFGGVRAFATEALTRYVQDGSGVPDLMKVAKTYTDMNWLVPAAWQRLKDDYALVESTLHRSL